MILATLNDGTRDGQLILISRDRQHYSSAAPLVHSLQQALDDWDALEPALQKRSTALNARQLEAFPLDLSALQSPLPRAYEWVDGSAYINHIELVRRARGAEPPATLKTVPLVYQGGSSSLLSPQDDIPLGDPAWGLDFEAELCVVLADTPMGTHAHEAAPYVRLIMLANDVSLRNLIPEELARGFGFFQSKPSTAFSPFALTPDELGTAWQDGRVHLPLRSTLNGTIVGEPHAGPEMHFSFYDLIAHITRTRAFGAGTLLGSGTVSNRDPGAGVSCLAERRMRETIDEGKARTPFMQVGDHIQIEMFDEQGISLFGPISQRVVKK